MWNKSTVWIISEGTVNSEEKCLVIKAGIFSSPSSLPIKDSWVIIAVQLVPFVLQTPLKTTSLFILHCVLQNGIGHYPSFNVTCTSTVKCLSCKVTAQECNNQLQCISRRGINTGKKTEIHTVIKHTMYRKYLKTEFQYYIYMCRDIVVMEVQYQSKVWTHLLIQGFFFICTIFYIVE